MHSSIATSFEFFDMGKKIRFLSVIINNSTLRGTFLILNKKTLGKMRICNTKQYQQQIIFNMNTVYIG
jgi:hypothetical protein